MKTLLVGLIALTGCLMPGPHVPSDLAGDVPIRMANKTDKPICAMLMQPFADANARADNWLGTSLRQQPIKAGAEREFKIKTGVYRFAVGGCSGDWAAGTQQGKLEIEGATYVAIGVRADAPASYRLAYFPVIATPQGQIVGGGGEQSEPSGGEPAAEASGEPSGNSESKASAPEAKSCLASGPKTDNDHKCCSESARTQIEPVEGIFTCSPGPA